MILKSEIHHFHRLELTRQAGFIVTVYDEDGLRLAATAPLATPQHVKRSEFVADQHDPLRAGLQS